MKTLIPTQLFVGPHDEAVAAVEYLLQECFCKHANKEQEDSQEKTQEKKIKRDCFCVECRRIKQRQHPFLVWLCPERDYKVDDLSIIFEKVRFALDSDQQKFFFVLEKAHVLNKAAANKLLKILEEPPTGYCFVLITSNEGAMLETIRSRSHVVRLSQLESSSFHAFLRFFYGRAKHNDPILFDKELRQLHFSDSQSTQLAYDMLTYFSQKIIAFNTNEPKSDNDIAMYRYYQDVIIFLKQSLRKPPQSGSSELFWKNMFLRFPEVS